MARYLLTALRISVLSILLVGVIYPLLIFGVGQVLFPHQANGSLIRDGQTVRGSTLIGQTFTTPWYFHPRPSAAGDGYDPLNSGGSNLAPTNPKLRDRVATTVAQQQTENPGLTTVPVDMVTTSASGLDPDITLANAYAQIPRVAAARHLAEAQVRTLVDQHLTGRQWGVFGEPRVNVVQLNRALDATQGTLSR